MNVEHRTSNIERPITARREMKEQTSNTGPSTTPKARPWRGFRSAVRILVRKILSSLFNDLHGSHRILEQHFFQINSLCIHLFPFNVSRLGVIGRFTPRRDSMVVFIVFFVFSVLSCLFFISAGKLNPGLR
jgi:hypothetical protein